MPSRCLSLCKDTNFKANHNLRADTTEAPADVCRYAKIRILKQITTSALKPLSGVLMFVAMQRYEF